MSGITRESSQIDRMGHADGVALHNETFDISDAALGGTHVKRYYLEPRFLGTVVALGLGVNSANLGYTLSANSLAKINADIGPSDNLLWVSLAYTLSLSVAFLLIGRLSDIFGRRYFFVVGNFFAVIGCIMGGTAQSINVIIGGNVFNGLAAGVQISFGMAVQELVPNKHRAIWTGSIYGSGLAMIGFGPVIAQALNDYTVAGWRWCFYLGIIVAGVCTALLALCYFPPDFHLLHTRRSIMEQIKRQDFIGIILFVGGLVVFLIGLNWGGVAHPWKSAPVITTVIIGFLTMVAFAVYETQFKKDVLLPMHLFKSRGFVPMLCSVCVGSCVYYSMVILWPQEIAILFGGGAIHRGLVASVLGCAVELGQFSSGMILHWLPYHQALFSFSCMLLTASCGGMAAVQPGDESLGIGLMFMAGLAVGLIETTAVILLPLSCPAEDLGAALGALGSIRSAVAAVATAIYVAILTSKMTSIVPAMVESAAVQAGLPKSSVPSLLENYSVNLTVVPDITPSIISDVEVAIAQGSADAYRYVWYSVIAFGCVAIISSLFTINYGEYMTDEVARKLRTSGGLHRGAHEHTEKPSFDPLRDQDTTSGGKGENAKQIEVASV